MPIPAAVMEGKIIHTHSPRSLRFKSTIENTAFDGGTILIKGPGQDETTTERQAPKPPMTARPYVRPPKVQAPKLLLKSPNDAPKGEETENAQVQTNKLPMANSWLLSPRLPSPRLPSPRLPSPRLASPRLPSPHLTSHLPVLVSGAGMEVAAVQAAMQATMDGTHGITATQSSQPLAKPTSDAPGFRDRNMPFHDSLSPGFQREVAEHHSKLKSHLNSGIHDLRLACRLLDASFANSSTCDRGNLKHVLNTMFKLDVPDRVMDQIISLGDCGEGGAINFEEFARIFTSANVHLMEEPLSAKMSNNSQKKPKVSSRQPIGYRMSNIKAAQSHFPPGLLVPVNDTWEMPYHIPRKLTSSRSPRLEPPPREPRSSPPLLWANWASEGRSGTNGGGDFRDVRAAGKPLGREQPLTLRWEGAELPRWERAERP